MQLKLSQVIEIANAIKSVLDKSLPATVGYELSVFIKRVTPELTALEEQRVSLIKKLGKEEGGNFVVSPEKMAEFHAEYQPLLDKEVSVDVTPISVASLKDAALPVSFFIACEPLLIQ